LRTENFDPLQYIENAFLDTRKAGSLELPDDEEFELPAPTLAGHIEHAHGTGASKAGVEFSPAVKSRFRKTVMSAPRPRRSKSSSNLGEQVMDGELHSVWQTLPKSVEFLSSFYDDAVTANYYRGEFKESRQELIRRLLDPELSLEETSRLLGVCPATVRRYTNRGWLAHHRTKGSQRRFRLSDIVRFVDEHGRFPEA
jgi:excisionase family DNA binding protein